MSYNKTILIGNLTKDPELRYTSSGAPVTSFSIAVNSKTKQGDEWKDEVLYMAIVAFARQAETCGEYLSAILIKKILHMAYIILQVKTLGIL